MLGRTIRVMLSLIGLVCVMLAVSPTTAQTTMRFPVARDVGIDAWENHGGYGGFYDKDFETEEFTNHGGVSEMVRAKKLTQHTVLMDWDSDAINQWLDDNTRAGDILSWTFNVYPVAAPPEDIQIWTLESLNDWAEGDGPTDYANFNWTEDTGAATQNFAVTFWDTDNVGDKVLDLERSVPWIDDDFGTGGIDDQEYSILSRGDSFSSGDPIPNSINSTDLSSLDLEDAVFDFTFADVPLDDQIVDAILHDPNNRGIVFGPLNVSNISENWQIWTREGTGDTGDPLAAEFPGAAAPFLEVTVTPGGPPPLEAGDADQDFDFDQLDLVQVQIAGKYLTGRIATWGEGDWNAAPGGTQGSPPPGNGLFDQVDIIAALAAGRYLQGPYAAATTHAVQATELGVATSPVPEPSSLILLVLGLGLASGKLCRRRLRYN